MDFIYDSISYNISDSPDIKCGKHIIILSQDKFFHQKLCRKYNKSYTGWYDDNGRFIIFLMDMIDHNPSEK